MQVALWLVKDQDVTFTNTSSALVSVTLTVGLPHLSTILWINYTKYSIRFQTSLLNMDKRNNNQTAVRVTIYLLLTQARYSYF